MSKAGSRGYVVEVELPEEAFRGRERDARAVAQELRLLWLLEAVRERRLGFGKAAELADLPQARFLDLMGEHHITPFDYDADELARELGSRPMKPNHPGAHPHLSSVTPPGTAARLLDEDRGER